MMSIPYDSVPRRLRCHLCDLVMSSAVMTPCCATSACANCAKDKLIREAKRCWVEGCGKGLNLRDLIPFRSGTDLVGLVCLLVSFISCIRDFCQQISGCLSKS